MPLRWLQDSAQGFNPGTLKINEFALKGREAYKINLAPIRWAEIKCGNQDVLHLDSAFKLLVRCVCRPFRAHRSGWRFPGLKPG